MIRRKVVCTRMNSAIAINARIYFHNLIGFLLCNNLEFNPIEMINLTPVNSINELPLDDLELDQYHE